MSGLNTAGERGCNVPLVPRSLVVTQVTLHTSTCQFSLLWVLTSPFLFTDS